MPKGKITMLDKAVIDLSHWDEVESFAAAMAAGVVGIIHKATENNNYFDPTYLARKADAEDAGLLWGAYHFLRPGNMQQQADYFVGKVGKDLDLYAADHEDEGVSLDDLKVFLRRVFDLTGQRAVIYSGHVLKEQIGSAKDAELAQYRLWLAQYTSGTPSWPKATFPKWWIWQYTEHGDCPGIPGDSDGNLDLNKYSGTADQLRKEWTGDELAPAPAPVEVVVDITAPPGVRVKVNINGNAA
jgi:lysozyme